MVDNCVGHSTSWLPGVHAVYVAVLHPQFSDSLNRIWCYYESFLGQTQLLNVEPLRELANMFNNLKVSFLTDITNNAKMLYRHKQTFLTLTFLHCKHSVFVIG